MAQPQLPRQQDPANVLPEKEDTTDNTEHNLEYQAWLSQEPAKLSTRKFVVSIILWFVVLTCGLLPGRSDATLQSGSQLDYVWGDRVAEDVTPRTWYNLNCDSVLAELDLLAAYKSNATTPVPAAMTRSAVPESPQAVYSHPELALLVDLCPLLQGEQDTHAEDLVGYTDICDGSQYALPCHMQAKLDNPSSLARFTIACNKHHSCRSWWLQHQSQHGVCGCAPLTSLVYPNQHAGQAELIQEMRHPTLSLLSVCLWMLIPFGRLSAPCQRKYHSVCALYRSSTGNSWHFLACTQSMLLVLIKGCDISFTFHTSLT